MKQSRAVFRVGTDAVLLGALASAGNSAKILEIGAGTGIVSLMLVQRNPSAEILAIDIDKMPHNWPQKILKIHFFLKD